MSLTIEITGSDPRASSEPAAALLRALAGTEPEQAVTEPGGAVRRDLATAISIASLVLSLPGAVLAVLQIKDHLDRRALTERVQAVQRDLEQRDNEATITMPDGRTLDLRRTSSGVVVDVMLRDLGR
ncbi:MAG: hypothetical protein AAF677_03145 [Pseudomonadota bacterium]